MEAKFAAFVNDAESRRVLQQLNGNAKVQRGNVRNAVRTCRENRSADVMLVDLDGEQNPLPHVSSLLQVCRPESVILATGSENNVALANDLYRGGIFLYLPKPLDVVNLRNAINEVAAESEEEARPRIQASRVVVMLGKGMGISTVTAMLAHLAAAQGRYVTCVDLDPNFGTLALALDTQPERGLAQALQDREGCDGAAIERLQSRVSERIGLVAHPIDQAGDSVEECRNLDDVLGELSNQAHMIVVCGTSIGQMKAMRHLATDYLVVFEPSPAGVSIASRWLRVLEGAPSTLVMNHTRPFPKLVHQDQLRDAFGDRSPDIEIPYIKALAEATALGEPERAIARREREALNRFLRTLLGVGQSEEAA